jgi:hypothetical protein
MFNLANSLEADLPFTLGRSELHASPAQVEHFTERPWLVGFQSMSATVGVQQRRAGITDVQAVSVAVDCAGKRAGGHQVQDMSGD